MMKNSEEQADTLKKKAVKYVSPDKNYFPRWKATDPHPYVYEE